MTDCLSRFLTGASLVLLLIAAVLMPGAALGAPRPGESCPDTTSAPGTTTVPGSTAAVCGEGKGPVGDPGGGAVDVSGILPFVAAAAGGAVIALAAAFFVLRRRADAPAAPADPGEWWTCANCGRNNVIGSPRCYACGHWQG
jgi:hypothetical protein